MTKTFDRVIMFGIIVGMIFLTLLFVMQEANKVDANGNITEGNFATSTRNSTGNPMASSTQLVTSSSRVSGVFTSFTITGVGAAPVTFYDATTSNANLRTITATSSLKVIANFPASTAVGNYVIDGVFNDGLLYDVSGSSSGVPTSTITWKL